MEIERLTEILSRKNAVVLSGAGISTASGIPDFRSADGLYADTARNCEEMLSIGFFNAHPLEFYEFLRESMLYPDARPNAAHTALAALEPEYVSAVVTQNIDRLHQAAGSENVIEVHGNLYDFYCTRCGKKYTVQKVYETQGVPCCDCGGILRPDIVFYGEQLNAQRIERSLEYISKANSVIVIGSSLTVYPVAGFVRYARGELIIINRDKTPFDEDAALVMHENAEDVLSAAAARLTAAK